MLRQALSTASIEHAKRNIDIGLETINDYCSNIENEVQLGKEMVISEVNKRSAALMDFIQIYKNQLTIHHAKDEPLRAEMRQHLAKGEDFVAEISHTLTNDKKLILNFS